MGRAITRVTTQIDTLVSTRQDLSVYKHISVLTVTAYSVSAVPLISDKLTFFGIALHQPRLSVTYLRLIVVLIIALYFFLSYQICSFQSSILSIITSDTIPEIYGQRMTVEIKDHFVAFSLRDDIIRRKPLIFKSGLFVVDDKIALVFQFQGIL
jgi:hypothetical protein